MLLFKPMVHEVVRVPLSCNCFLNSLSRSALFSTLLSAQSSICSLLYPSVLVCLRIRPLVAGPGDYIQGTAAIPWLLLGLGHSHEREGVGKGTPKGREGKGSKGKEKEI